MTTMTPPEYGDPFLAMVTEGNLDGRMSPEDVGLIRRVDLEADAVSYAKAEVADYGGAQQIYLCIPIGRIWTDDPARDETAEWSSYHVQAELTETVFERMAAAALAMGVSDDGARHKDAA